MKGFFKKQEVTTPKKKRYNTAKISGCESCKQYHKCMNGKMGVQGSGKSGILIIDSAVSPQEESTGIPYTGLSQKYLRDKLAELGVNLEDCWYVHSIRCYPGSKGEKGVTTAMTNGCKTLLKEDIKLLKPKKIITLGDIATGMIYNERLSESRVNTGFEKFCGTKIPDQNLKTMVFPNYSTTFIFEALQWRMSRLKKYNRFQKEEGPFWEWKSLKTDDNFRIRDLYFRKYLKEAIQHKEPFREYDGSKFCNNIQTVEEATAIMKSLNNEKELAFDFETNCLAPWANTSKLLTISFATNDVSYGFSYYPDNEEYMEALRATMENEKIKKVAAFIHMEYVWTRAIIGCDVKNVEWCTVLASHFLNPTISGGNSLKFNTIKYFGRFYDSEVEPYIKSPERYEYKRGKRKKIKDSPYDLNRMEEFPEHKRNLYCAEDSLYTMWIYKKQEKIIKNDKRMYPLYQLYLEGTILFSKTRERGFVVDELQLIKNLEYCDKQIDRLWEEIDKEPILDKWYTKNPNKEFNPASGDHLREFFFTILGYTTEKRTKNNQLSTDADVLENIAKTCPIATLIKDYSKYVKIYNTLDGLKRNTVNSRIHPFIGVSQASTGRSNSNSINFQNLDTKDKEAVKLVRGCLKVEDGMEIMMMDYSALEVKGGYSIHGDQTMKSELEDNTIDAHSLMAQRVFNNNNLDEVTLQIAKLKYPDKKTFTKDELGHIFKDDVRKIVKSTSFSLAYGGSYLRIFATLWNEEFSEYHKQYFYNIGMTVEAFKSHCKTLFEFYWNRYATLDRWRQETWERYLTHGYIYTPAGFRINGIRSKTFITNAPIQGSSYSIALWGIIKLNKEMEKRGYKSSVRLQIHDSNELAIVPDEYFNGGLKELIQECMVDFVNKNVKWLRFPMGVDGEFFLDNWSNEVKEEEVMRAYGIAS